MLRGAKRAPVWITANLAIVGLCSLVGCVTPAASRPTVIRESVSSPAAQVSATREAYEQAQKLDDKLMLGFFTVANLGRSTDLRVAQATFLKQLQQQVAPQTWQLPGRKAYFLDNTLVAFQREKVLQALGAWVETATLPVDKDERVIATDVIVFGVPIRESRSFEQDLLGEATPLTQSRPVPLAPRQVSWLREDSRPRVLYMPSLVALSGQATQIRIGQEQTFVRDYEIYYVNKNKICEPVMGTVTDGLSTKLLSTVNDQTNEIFVHLRACLSQIEGVHETSLQVGAAQPLVIQSPSVTEQRIEAEFVQRSGTACLLGGVKVEQQKIYVLVSSRVKNG